MIQILEKTTRTRKEWERQYNNWTQTNVRDIVVTSSTRYSVNRHELDKYDGIIYRRNDQTLAIPSLGIKGTVRMVRGDLGTLFIEQTNF